MHSFRLGNSYPRLDQRNILQPFQHKIKPRLFFKRLEKSQRLQSTSIAIFILVSFSCDSKIISRNWWFLICNYAIPERRWKFILVHARVMKEQTFPLTFYIIVKLRATVNVRDSFTWLWLLYRYNISHSHFVSRYSRENSRSKYCPSGFLENAEQKLKDEHELSLFLSLSLFVLLLLWYSSSTSVCPTKRAPRIGLECVKRSSMVFAGKHPSVLALPRWRPCYCLEWADGIRRRPFHSRTQTESDYTLIIYRVISDVCVDQLLENGSLN